MCRQTDKGIGKALTLLTTKKLHRAISTPETETFADRQTKRKRETKRHTDQHSYYSRRSYRTHSHVSLFAL